MSEMKREATSSGKDHSRNELRWHSDTSSTAYSKVCRCEAHCHQPPTIQLYIKKEAFDFRLKRHLVKKEVKATSIGWPVTLIFHCE